MNIQIFLEDLQTKYNEITLNNLIKDINIEYFRRMTTLDKTIIDETIYLIEKPSEVIDINGDKRIIVITAGENTYTFNNIAQIHLHTNENYEIVADNIQRIIEEYKDWYEDVIASLSKGININTLMDKLAIRMDNPFALFDSSMALIHWSGEFLNKVDGTIWEYVLKYNYVPAELFTNEEQKRLSGIQPTVTLYSYYPKFDQKHEYITIPIYINKTTFGSISLIDLNCPFTEGQCQILIIIAQIISRSLSNYTEFLEVDEGITYYLSRLIQGLEVEKKLVDYYLSLRNWKINDRYVLLNFSSNNDGSYDVFLGVHNSRISNKYPNAIIFNVENSIVVIINKKETIINEELSDLKEYVAKLHLTVGISSDFYNFADLKYAYIQSKLALEKIEKDSFEVCFFKDVYIDSTVNALNSFTSLKAMCHPKVLLLWEEDDEFSKILINNLKTYLACGCNISKTADTLCLHRNSLIYRLEKLEIIFGTDFKKLNEQDSFYIMMSCIIAEYL